MCELILLLCVADGRNVVPAAFCLQMLLPDEARHQSGAHGHQPHSSLQPRPNSGHQHENTPVSSAVCAHPEQLSQQCASAVPLFNGRGGKSATNLTLHTDCRLEQHVGDLIITGRMKPCLSLYHRSLLYPQKDNNSGSARPGFITERTCVSV